MNQNLGSEIKATAELINQANIASSPPVMAMNPIDEYLDRERSITLRSLQ